MIRTLVKDVMTKTPACCSPDAKLDAVAKLMLANNCGEIPVCDGAKLVGVVTDRDIAVRAFAAHTNPRDVHAREIMTDQLFTVSDTSDVETAALMMKTQRVSRLPVVHDGAIVGIISQGDVVTALPAVKAADFLKAISRRPL